jgi:hypothetical protein
MAPVVPVYVVIVDGLSDVWLYLVAVDELSIIDAGRKLDN